MQAVDALSTPICLQANQFWSSPHTSNWSILQYSTHHIRFMISYTEKI